MKDTIVLWNNMYKRQDVLVALELIEHSITGSTDKEILHELNLLSMEDCDNVQNLLGL